MNQYYQLSGNSVKKKVKTNYQTVDTIIISQLVILIMVIVNRIKEFLSERGLTAYQLWKATGISRTTAYALYNEPNQYPGKNVMESICQTFKASPGELLQNLDLSSLPSESFEGKAQLPKSTCVYLAIDEDNVVQYIGQTRNLNHRWQGRRHHRYKQLSEMPGIRIAYIEVSDRDLLPVIEKALIEWFKPALNEGSGRKPTTGTGKAIWVPLALVDEFEQEIAAHKAGTRLSPNEKIEPVISPELLKALIDEVLPRIPIRDRTQAAKQFRRLLTHLEAKN